MKIVETVNNDATIKGLEAGTYKFRVSVSTDKDTSKPSIESEPVNISFTFLDGEISEISN